MSKPEPTIDEMFAKADQNGTNTPPEPSTKANQLAKTDKRAPIALSHNRLEIRTVEDLGRMASQMWQTGVGCGGVNSKEDLYAVLLAGYESGLPLMAAVKNSMIINGRVTIWGDALWGLVLASGQVTKCETKYEGEGDNLAAIVTLARNINGTELEVLSRFSAAQAKTAGLWTKAIWKQYPDRMLMNRARTFAVRDLFADLIGGLSVREEAEESFDPSRARGAPTSRPQAEAKAEPDDFEDLEIQDITTADLEDAGLVNGTAEA